MMHSLLTAEETQALHPERPGIILLSGKRHDLYRHVIAQYLHHRQDQRILALNTPIIDRPSHEHHYTGILSLPINDYTTYKAAIMSGIRLNTDTYIIDNLNHPEAATGASELLAAGSAGLIIGSIAPGPNKTPLETLITAATPSPRINPDTIFTEHHILTINAD